MNRTLRRAALAALVFGIFAAHTLAQRYLSGRVWSEPKVITPGTDGSPPSDATVLFDGKNLDAWKNGDKQQIDDDGGFTSKSGLSTKQSFGDCQLHLEFASPKEVRGNDQDRGNNGVGLMGGRYEIQILDSYDNKTYFEGQCASVYNQRPPMVNASRKPGEWQSLDIIFTGPRFDEAGKLLKPAYATVLHNGVVVQNHTEVEGMTRFDQKPRYEKHAEKMPIMLKYHGSPVRFRNIWIREIKDVEPVTK